MSAGPGSSLLPAGYDESGATRIWSRCFAVAFVVEMFALTVAGWYNHWLAHPQSTKTDTSNFVEAQIFEVPKQTHLVEESKPKSAPKHEVVLSKVPNQGRPAKPDEKQLTDENQTEGGQKLAPTHGPVAVYSPPPSIPTYLQNQDLHVSVVIDFYVSSQGVTTPKLVNSSGNEELDAIALGTAKRWQFRPAEQDHKPVDSKVRLRILFEVK